MHSTVDELPLSRTSFSPVARWAGYVRLLRPANLVTSAADVVAGFLVVGAPAGQLLWRLIASIGLYAGGIVLNDFFDRALDATERPERPIPSGIVSPTGAAILGVLLLAGAIGAGFLASPLTGIIALTIALCVLAYDAGMKHSAVGPVLMGACRGLNLCLGLAAAPALLAHLWFLPLLPLAYITGITLLSRGEVLGGDRKTGALAVVLFAAVVFAAGALHLSQPLHLLAVAPFLILLVVKAGVPLGRAFRFPSATLIRGAVHAGVVSLIVLDAALAAGYAGVLSGAALLLLSLIAFQLGKLFPVT